MIDKEYDYQKQEDRDAFRKRYPPITTMIGLKRMYAALEVLESLEAQVGHYHQVFKHLAEEEWRQLGQIREDIQADVDTIGMKMRSKAPPAWADTTIARAIIQRMTEKELLSLAREVGHRECGGPGDPDNQPVYLLWMAVEELVERKDR